MRLYPGLYNLGDTREESTFSNNETMTVKKEQTQTLRDGGK